MMLPEFSDALRTKAYRLKDFLEIAHRGERHGIHATKIHANFGIDRKQLCTITNFLRCQNYPIGSSQTGYYWCDTYSELLETIDQLQGRVIGINRALDGLYRAQKEWKTPKLSFPNRTYKETRRSK